jgi:hypothetical protein
LESERELPPVSREAEIPILPSPVNIEATREAKLIWINGLWRNLSQYMYIFMNKKNPEKYITAFMEPWEGFDIDAPQTNVYDLVIYRIARMKEALENFDWSDPKRYQELILWGRIINAMHDSPVFSDAPTGDDQDLTSPVIMDT